MRGSLNPLRVFVRIRPTLLFDGITHGGSDAACQAADTTTVKLDVTKVTGTMATRTGPAGAKPKQKVFAYDAVFGPGTSQGEVHACCCLPLLDAVLSGNNACLFAFGQTGAGKTHSMLGPEGGQQGSTGAMQAGILPRASAELFRRIARLSTHVQGNTSQSGAPAPLIFSEWEVRATFVEVYRETVLDLVGTSTPSNVGSASATKVTSTAQLLELVARGAQKRATAATGVHGHSSRSHAIITVFVEHRWRDAAEPNPARSTNAICSFNSQQSQIAFVDLAGAESMGRSHSGNFDASGAGTNLGLLHLGRCISALAEGTRPPWRDSTLTKLLKPNLSGNAARHMLACVSPGEGDAGQSHSTLQYAASARTVTSMLTTAPVVQRFLTDPMIGDEHDQDADLNRHTLWIEPRGYPDDVFARVAGDPSGPLILYVHGSGSHNSSRFWSHVKIDIANRTRSHAQLPVFYHVAIDCPGYGRSPGSMQTIRSEPAEFLSSVVRALGRRQACALLGSSQGACAVLNAACDTPKIAQVLAVCHPVMHAPRRFTGITQPTLHIYDTEDDGHPVAVGRQARRFLPNNRYYEFTGSVDGAWDASHMGEEVVRMLGENWAAIAVSKRTGCTVSKLPLLTRVGGGIKSWNSYTHGETAPYAPTDCMDLGSAPAFSDTGPAAASLSTRTTGIDERVQEDTWFAMLNAAENTLSYTHVRHTDLTHGYSTNVERTVRACRRKRERERTQNESRGTHEEEVLISLCAVCRCGHFSFFNVTTALKLCAWLLFCFPTTHLVGTGRLSSRNVLHHGVVTALPPSTHGVVTALLSI